MAFPDIQLPEQFTQRQAPLLSFVAMVISEGLQRIDGIVDSDARTALTSLAETYRTRQSGLIYESKPKNPIAAALFELFELRVSEYTQAQAQQTGLPAVLEGHVFGAILFYLRLAQQLDNKRRYSRSFLDAVLGFLPPSPAPLDNLNRPGFPGGIFI
ncbi:MAG: hypothetical protein NW208_09600 [Bryobacter sp.]|nr:hypothetical protein [Bryobacter sp.]